MPNITYIQTDGTEYIVQLPIGATFMEGAVQNNIRGIVAEGGGSCMCATCHVYIDEQFLNLISEKEEEEAEMLEGASAEIKHNSRLSCQVRVSNKLNGIIVRIPEKQ